ncbi:MAG: 2-oxo acid dehydrogenase subunit E2 [Promethearchaeota archaeon]
MIKKKKKPKFFITPFPPERLAIVDLMKDAMNHPTIYGFLELDVTIARDYIRQKKKETGEKLSFTGYIAYCMAKVIDENKFLHAWRKGKKNLYIFDDVDIMTMVERDVGGKKVPIGHIIRAANKKTIQEIHQEIRSAQTNKLGGTYQDQRQLNYEKLPWIFKKLMWRKFKRDPFFVKKFTGTCSLTAVGMFGKGTGWGMTPTGDTFAIILGGIGKKPAVIDNQVVTREFLSITLCFNHDIIDGAPASRCAMRIKSMIENGEGLIK